MGFKLWRLFPCTCLYLELRLLSIYYPVMDSHEAKSCFPISLQLLHRSCFWKDGGAGLLSRSFWVSKCGVLVMLWSSQTSHVSSQVRRTSNSSKCHYCGGRGPRGPFSCPAMSMANPERREGHKTPPPFPSPYHWLASSPSVLTPRPEVSSPVRRGPGGSGGCPDGSLSPAQPPLWPERRWSLSVCL